MLCSIFRFESPRQYAPQHCVSLMALPLMRPVESRCGPAHRSVNSPWRVEGDVRVFGQVVDELDLVRLFLLFHKLDGLVARQLKALELQLFLADLAHLGLKLGPASPA